ncbi:MAG: hypothetical protein AAGU78_08305 [Chloroflexota bacterium]|jgi:hypothetical protein|nr:hypothetical protein [Anaerolineae bacterium]HMM27722.1 hypothetical protein [Aggregatilineaceae bacterium]
MASSDKKPQRPANEPRFLPSQAEGERGEDKRVEHLRTPNKAEGKPEDVEETLRDEENESTE